jgi:hypothetical protein
MFHLVRRELRDSNDQIAAGCRVAGLLREARAKFGR